jgi:hypothetical protein
MKSMFSILTVASVLSLALDVTPALAQDDGAPQHSERIASARQTDDDKVPGGGEATHGGDRMRWIGRRARMSPDEAITKLTKLQAKMKEELDLSAEQAEKIDGHFKKQLDSLEKRKSGAKSKEVRPYGLEEIQGLRDELAEARKAGDKTRAREIRKQMSEKLRKGREDMPVPTGRFVQVIASELKEGQLATYNKLVKELELETMAPRPRRSPISSLMRAVMNPEVGLSPEQQQGIREVMRKHMSTMGRDMTETQQEQVFERMRDEILAQLTPEQRTKATERLEALEKEASQPPRGVEPRKLRPEGTEED